MLDASFASRRACVLRAFMALAPIAFANCPLLRLTRALRASTLTAVTELMAASALPLFLRLATLRRASQRVMS